MATAKSKKKKQKDPNATPRLKFPVRKEVSKEEYETAVAAVKTAWRTHQVSARDFGWKLLKLRKLMYHGQFTNWLRANSIDINHASYCMRVFQGLTQTAKERIKNLPQTVMKKQIDILFKPAEEKLPELVSPQVADFILETVMQLGKASGWTFKPDVLKTFKLDVLGENRTFSAMANPLAGPLVKAVNTLLDELFVWEDFLEPENQVTMKVPPASKTSQWHEREQKAQAAAAVELEQRATAGGPPRPPRYSSPARITGP